MATYAIGDIQGCYHAFCALLAKFEFDEKKDQLWLVGDLVNRGTGSLEVLRWCYQHSNSIRVVLGNHDLHTLVVAHGVRPPHRSDTLQALLDAPDSDELLTWLRHQPLIWVEHGYAMVHAGLLPQWTIQQAQGYAREVEATLQGDEYETFLRHMYGNQPAIWSDSLMGLDRLRIITNSFTRLRICSPAGEMEFSFKGELQDIPDGYLPWFDVPNRMSADTTIVCGHWSALGLKVRKDLCALDTGCLWGGMLTAMRLEDRAVFQVNHDARDKFVK